MKYTIPYDDKITLPHVKSISTIGVNTNNVTYDKKELNGEVIVTGEYSLDNSEDVMEFSHDIPISFLIDDEEVSPRINISNFKHELIPGRGIEIMFDLDVLLQTENETVTQREENTEAEEVKEFQNKIDENLNEVLNNAGRKDSVNEEETNLPEEQITEKENVETPVKQRKEKKNKAKQVSQEQEVTETPKETPEEQTTEVKEEMQETPEEQTIEEKEEMQETPEEQAAEEAEGTEEMPEQEEEKLNTTLSPTLTSFDTAFIPRDHDKYTTYKIILLEGDEDIDSVLQARNLSKALICNEYTSDKKIILKIEHD